MKTIKKVKFKIMKTKNPLVKIIVGTNNDNLVVFEKFQSNSMHEMRKAKNKIFDRFEMMTPYEHIEDK